MVLIWKYIWKGIVVNELNLWMGKKLHFFHRNSFSYRVLSLRESLTLNPTVIEVTDNYLDNEGQIKGLPLAQIHEPCDLWYLKLICLYWAFEYLTCSTQPLHGEFYPPVAGAEAAHAPQQPRLLVAQTLSLHLRLVGQLLQLLVALLETIIVLFICYNKKKILVIINNYCSFYLLGQYIF